MKKIMKNYLTLPRGKKVWDHQEAAFNKVVGRVGGMLAMGMRTGKTLVGVALTTHYAAKRILVLAPLNGMGVWERDFPLSVLDYPVLLLDKPGTKNKVKQFENFNYGVVVINWEAAWRSPLCDSIIAARFDLVIYDEIHRIKAPGGKASKFCSRLKSHIPKRLGLTGTLMPNSPLDVYAQFRALDVSIYGTNNNEFKSQYCDMEQLKLKKPLIGKYGKNKGKMINEVSVLKNYKNMKEFAARMAKITYTCELDDVIKDIPPLVHEEICFTLPPKARKIYDGMKNELVAWLGSGERITAANVLVKTLRLQQIICGHSKDENDKVIIFDDTKEKILYDFLLDVPANQPVCVYCVFKEDLKAVERVAVKLGRKYGEVSGARKDITDDAKMPDWVDLYGIQIKSGKEALDFSRASIGVFYSVNHSSGDFQQACARQRNPDKKNRVALYHIIARNTIGRTVYTALTNKKNLADEITKHLKEG
ncbi:MAG TPA: hypothetical protein ENH91_12085 [Leeuwenhoekiella sp.]|nr:hypothetical protein [Leeuwenhoekiella sp.]